MFEAKVGQDPKCNEKRYGVIQQHKYVGYWQIITIPLGSEAFCYLVVYVAKLALSSNSYKVCYRDFSMSADQGLLEGGRGMIGLVSLKASLIGATCDHKYLFIQVWDGLIVHAVCV